MRSDMEGVRAWEGPLYSTESLKKYSELLTDIFSDLNFLYNIFYINIFLYLVQINEVL